MNPQEVKNISSMALAGGKSEFDQLMRMPK